MKIWNYPVFLMLTLTLLFTFTPARALAEGSSSGVSEASDAADTFGSADASGVSDISSEQNTGTGTILQVNPLYADVFTESDLEDTLSAIPLPYDETDAGEEPSFPSDEDASAYLRTELVSRNPRVSFSFFTEDDDYYHVVRSLFSLALEETGNPEEGDYLRYQYGGYSCGIRYSHTGGRYHYTLTYTITYYTSREQEQQVTHAAEEILSGLNLKGKTAYEKAESIYRYLVSSVSYDYDHLYDTEYTLKYSAYAALINKTAICQGYAVALYRLMMEAGIPCRVIGGMAGSESHAWNIVQLRGLWYNTDSTWDSESWDPSRSYSWFLLSDHNFSSHTRDEQYRTDEFYRSYPMGPADFTPGLPEEYDLSTKKVILSASSLPYTGSALKPAVTIAGLTEGTDYKVTYKNNIHAGTASVIITGIGNCTGSAARTTFTITRAKNTWTVAPSCSGITCSSAPKPKGAARFGRVSFRYSTGKNSSWSEKAPSVPGTFYVKASVAGTDDYTGLSAVVSFRVLLAQPAVSLSNSASGITVRWSTVKGASGYHIYRKIPGGWKKVKTVKDASVSVWTETGLTNGSRYFYSVRAFYGSTESAGTLCRSIYRISRPSVSSLKNTGSGKIVIKWQKNKAATGYQIQYSTDSSFKNAKTLTVSANAAAAKLLQKTVSSLSKRKRYYVRIRSCKITQGTRSYSAWSPVKNVLISR